MQLLYFLFLIFCIVSSPVCWNKNGRLSFNAIEALNIDQELQWCFSWYLYWRPFVSVSCITQSVYACWKSVFKLLGDSYGEEKGWRCKEEIAEYVWVLDPIDGTKSFITGTCLSFPYQLCLTCSSNIHESVYFLLTRETLVWHSYCSVVQR